MNSTLTLDEEQSNTSSVQPTAGSKYKLPNALLERFQDSASTMKMLIGFDTGFYLTTVPTIDFALVQDRPRLLPSVAEPSVAPLHFEINPIVKVHPPTGKRYPMRVVDRSVGSFKQTSLRLIGENTECSE